MNAAAMDEQRDRCSITLMICLPKDQFVSNGELTNERVVLNLQPTINLLICHGLNLEFNRISTCIHDTRVVRELREEDRSKRRRAC